MKGNKLCVIMQPTYLPWLGYFDLIDQSDVFILLDNVQYEKQSWQQRNRIRSQKGLEWISVPSFTKGKMGQLIGDVSIVQSNIFPRNHLRTIEMNYRRSHWFAQFYPGLHDIMVSGIDSLCDLNISLIKWLSSVLALEANFFRSSELEGQGKRSALLVDLCNKVGARHYLSTIGAEDYLKREIRIFSDASIEVSLHNYEHPQYRQLYSPFMPYASVLDLLFNEGERSLEIIRSGRRNPLRITA